MVFPSSGCDTFLENFTVRKIFLFALPTIGTLLVFNLYTTVDGYFISNYLGKTAFAAENLIAPVLLLFLCLGTMFGTGGNALVSYTLGQGDREKACQIFTQTLVSLTAFTVIVSAVLWLFMPQLSRLVGAPEETLPMCVQYGRILTVFLPVGVNFLACQSMLITAGKSTLGTLTSILNAAVNIILDYILVVPLGIHDIRAIGLASALGWVAGMIPALVYFGRRNSLLHFTAFSLDTAALGQTLKNGLSEMVDSASVSIVAIIYNLALIRFFGTAGVDAYGVIAYVSEVFLSVSMGRSMSASSAVSCHCGEKDRAEVLGIRRNGTLLNLLIGLMMCGLSVCLSGPIAGIFFSYDAELYALTVKMLKLYSLSFLFSGVTVFGAGFYTGLNDGLTSAAIALVKALLLPCLLIGLCVLLRQGDWLLRVTPVSELLTFGMVFLCYRYRVSLLPPESGETHPKAGTDIAE